MKNLIFTIISTLISLSLYCQIDYPKYEIDSLGQKVIVMTIEQAQSLDNSTDLIPLLKKLNMQSNSSDSICIKVVNEKDVIIAKQEVQINQQKDLLSNKDQQIQNLKQTINEYKNKESLYQQEIKNKDAEINLHLKKIKNQKLKMIVGGSVGGLAIIGLIIGILSIH